MLIRPQVIRPRPENSRPRPRTFSTAQGKAKAKATAVILLPYQTKIKLVTSFYYLLQSIAVNNDKNKIPVITFASIFTARAMLALQALY